MAPPNFSKQPPQNDSLILAFPTPHILLVTINREKAMNSIPFAVHWAMHALFSWFDAEPELRVAVITGKGKKAFCAGQDLIELGKRREAASSASAAGSEDAKIVEMVRSMAGHPPSGFAGISRRVGKKPIIAAVNGFALGGGFEIVLNCDMIVASPTATFGLPEALRGIYAGAGGLPRLLRNTSLPLANEIALTARFLSAQEALNFQLINKVSKSQETVVEEAIALAEKVAAISPDAIIVSRAAIREAWERDSVERAFQTADDRWRDGLMSGENTKEGLLAFKEKRQPKWRPSKL
ncbi:uncharacterized protein HMPREF1541_08989 [Cyphellophora europaea CBS 101466]|uniref:Enoyl-CoA hydratase n=1 Tax=Cyphellophora europaea (strain CBS 101466) TaxID=1220924 RepID=W2RJQ5_CYPE1|nr:uncharacterized protein HMPREF1541_08989 [Cyphellophora europaea CBS 101466]ETN36711.1 hypothetical protein HMPREF1541_08989 [Cyphellophora europaea CBS 101466]